jgi:hypothetical protein
MEKFKNTRPPAKYFLSNSSEGVIQLYHAPDGWDSDGYSLSRSAAYSGVNRKYAINKLGFVKEGKEYLEKVEAEQGFEAEIEFIEQLWDGSENLTYYESFRGNIQLVDKDVSDTKYTVSIADSSFENKLFNRDSVPVILTKKTPDEEYKSLDGKTIAGFANEGNLFTLPSRIDYFNNSLISNREESYTTVIVDSDYVPIVPILNVENNEDSNVKGNTNEFKSINGAFWSNSSGSSASVDINGTINGTASVVGSTADDITLKLYVLNASDEITKEIDVPLEKTFIGTFVDGIFTFVKYTISGTISITETIETGSYIQFGVYEQGTIGRLDSGFILDFSARTQGCFVPQINSESMMIHEVFARIGQKITSGNSPFYSDLLGRKDSEPRSYTYTNEAGLLTITNGGLIRGFGMMNNIGFDEPIAPISVTLEDTFNAINSVRPIGLGVESVNGEKVFRIEDLKYFFDTRTAILIDNATEIKKEYNKDLIHNEIQIGFSKAETDEIRDGLYDYNTKSSWTNATESVSSKETIVSSYSASNTSINEARKITKEDNPTTDSKYDSINYMIEVVENANGNAMVNGNAEDGLNGWGEVTSGVSVQNLIGSNRFVIIQNDSSVEYMLQQIGAINEPVLSFSYALISENELTLTPTAQITARLNSGDYKSLNQNGDWIDGQSDFPITSIKGVQENSLQSLNKFEIAANERLEDINYINVSFDTEFLQGQSGVNKLVIDDIYLSDSAKLKARTTEGFDSIDGIVNSTDSYNINLSPARSRNRHGFKFRASLDDKLSTSLVFSNADKISTLVSKKTDEDDSVSESSDILVNDLDEPIWGVEKITFDADLTSDQKIDLNSNFADGKPKKLALIGHRPNEKEAYSYGWIEDFKSGGINGVSSFEIRPVSKYINVAEEEIFIDYDGVSFTDDDNIEFTGE